MRTPQYWPVPEPRTLVVGHASPAIDAERIRALEREVDRLRRLVERLEARLRRQRSG